MLTRRFTQARVAATSLLALAALAACSETSTTSPTGPSPFGAAHFVVIPTPSQIIAGADLGAFTNTINANESGRLTTEFWDNISSDNNGTSHCNIGFYATGNVGTSCLVAAPGSNANATGGFVNYWGDNGAPAGSGQDAASFMFNGTFAYDVTLKGSYAGAGSTVGWFTKTGTTYTFHPVAGWSSKTVNTLVNIPVQAAGTNWGFFINTLTPQPGGCGGAANPNFACSDATGSFTAAPNQQFALFTNAGATSFLVGTEDNELKLLGDLPNPSLHDSDYNDYIFSVVPIIPPPPVENHGCTLGFWKNHTADWHTYTPGTLVGSVFANTGTASGSTLLEALSFGGGPTVQDAKNLLLKQAVAALLNSTTPGMNYPLTTAQVIAQVNAAMATNNRATILALANTLDGFNSLEGPLC